MSFQTCMIFFHHKMDEREREKAILKNVSAVFAHPVKVNGTQNFQALIHSQIKSMHIYKDYIKMVTTSN